MRIGFLFEGEGEALIKAFKNNEVPVGCVIVRNDEILAKSFNKKVLKQVKTLSLNLLIS